MNDQSDQVKQLVSIAKLFNTRAREILGTDLIVMTTPAAYSGRTTTSTKAE